MFFEVIEDAIKTFLMSPEQESKRLLFLAINVFLDEYRALVLSQRSSIEQLLTLAILYSANEIIIKICKEQQIEYFEELIDRDFGRFQRYINNEIMLDPLAKGKSLALYAEYRYVILEERSSYTSFLAKLGSAIFFIFRIEYLMNEEKMNPLDRFLTCLNVFCITVVNIYNLENTGSNFDFVEIYEEKISEKVLNISENNQIISETGMAESEFDKISELMKTFTKYAISTNYYTASILNCNSKKAVDTETVAYVIISFFMTHNDSVKLFLSTEFPNIFKDLRCAFFYYHSIKLKCRLYQKRLKEFEDRKMIPMVDGPIFVGNNVIFEVNGAKIIDNVSYQFSKGEWVSIYGESGCGKTTFCNIILGKLTGFTGDILFCGQKYSYLDIYEYTSYVSPSGDILKESILENCLYGIKYVTEKHIEKLKHYLLLFGLGDLDLNSNCLLISTGEKQRIKIIRLILIDRPIWILDEITSNIDNDMAVLIMNILREIGNTKLVISISHNPKMIISSDKYLPMETGKIVYI